MSKFRTLLFGILISSSLVSACTNSSARSEYPTTQSNDLLTANSFVPQNSEDRLTFEEFAEQQRLPRSEDFPVKKSETFSGTPAKPVLTGKRARLYKTVLREAAERGPNFAGRYTVVTWGAGMGSFSLTLIDAKTGKIYFPPFESISITNYGLPGLDEGSNPAFRLDSKLFAFIGCPGKEYEGCSDWNKDGFYLYSFDNGRFKLERFVERKELEATLRK